MSPMGQERTYSPLLLTSAWGQYLSPMEFERWAGFA